VRGRNAGARADGERFVRSLKLCSSSLRKPAGAKIVSHEIMKYADYIKTVSLPRASHRAHGPSGDPSPCAVGASLVFGVVTLSSGGTAGNFGWKTGVLPPLKTVSLKGLVDLNTDRPEGGLEEYKTCLAYLGAKQRLTAVIPLLPMMIWCWSPPWNGDGWFCGKVMFCYPYSLLGY